MLIYSETLALFSSHAESLARDILERECGLEVKRTRFWVGTTSWPLNIVAFEGTGRWGYFDSHTYQIGLNAKLAGLVKDATLRDLLRHEIAHYLCFVFHGPGLPHGEAFKSICARFGWPEDVARASGDLMGLDERREGDLETQSLVAKVKKLMALASSDNPHEAKLATLKANQLILKHHLTRSSLESERELCVADVMKSAKRSAKMIAIYDILTHFLVKPFLFYGREGVRLQVMGRRAAVELAEYVAYYLDQELEHLWKLESKTHGLKGLRAKNSFFHGVAKGYGEKLKLERQGLSQENERALIVVEADLTNDMRLYLRTSSGGSSGHQSDSHALGLGQKRGHGLTIRPAVTSGDSRGQISYQK